MHEVALISSALEQAIAEARKVGAVRIRQLTFTLAPDAHITEESLEWLVPILAKGSIAEDARLQIGPRTDLDGRDLVLSSIEVEVDDGQENVT